MGWSLASGQALDITAPLPQTIEPGGWVSLAFRIEGESWAKEDQPCPQPKLITPPGWSVLIAPTRLLCPIHAPVVLTTTLSAPKDATAGRYDIVLGLGSVKASSEVSIKAKHSLLMKFRVDRNAPMPRWWIAEPMEVPLDVALTGNQALSVSLQAKAPDGIEVQLSPEALTMRPDDFNTATVRMRAKAPSHWPAGARIPIRIIALDENNQILKTISQTWVAHTDVGVQAPQLTWPITGYVQSHHRWDDRIQRDFDWGLSGQWVLDHEGQGTDPLSRVHFSYASDRPWQRYVAYDSEAFQIILGHQVLGDRGVARPLQLAQGVSLSGGQQMRVGLEAFEGQNDVGERYYRPWIEQGAWRYAWIRRSRVDGGSDQGWSLAYRPSRYSNLGQSRVFDVQVAGSASGVAAWVDVSDRLSDDLRYRMQFQSMPPDHISSLTPGERWRLDLVTSSQAAIQSGWMVALRRNNARAMDHHWMGYVKQHLWASVYGRLSGEHDSIKSVPSLDLSLWGRGSSMAWRVGLNTRGRWQLSLRGPVQHLGRWSVHHRRSHEGHGAWRTGLEGRHGDLWRWAVGLERSEVVSLSQPFARPSATEMNDFAGVGFSSVPMGLEVDVRSNNALSLSLTRQVGRVGEWSLHLQQSLSAQKAGRLMLRYRWQHRLKAPIGPKASLSTIKGRVLRHASSGQTPVAGVWLWLGMRSTQTDADGQYHFNGVQPGVHRLRLEDQNTRQGWLSRDGGSQQVVVDRDKAVELDWTLVAMGSITGRIRWPASSPVEMPNWSSYQLLGRCMSCVLTHRHRQVRIDADGRFEAKHMAPGLWQWRLVGPVLPKDHASMVQGLETVIEPGEEVVLEWEISHRPSPVQWQTSDRVLVIP